MASRNAEVDIRVNVSSIHVSPEAAAQARASIEGGGNGSSPDGGGRTPRPTMDEETRWRTQEETRQRRRDFMAREFPQNPPGGMQAPTAFDVAGNVAGGAGQLGLRRQIISLGYLGQMLGAVTPEVWALVAAFAALAAGVLVFVGMTKTAINIVQTFGKIMLGQLKLCYEGVMALGRGFFWLMQEAIGGTVRVVEWFGQKTVETVEWAVGAFRRMADEGVKAYMDLEQQVARTITVMGKFGDKATAMRPELMAFAMDVSSKMRYTASEVAAAMYEAHSAVGNNVEAVKALTQASLNLAAATMTDVTPAMEFMGSVLNAYHIDVSKASQVSDMFFNAIFNSSARMDKLVASMKFAGPAAAEFGISLKETIGILEGFYRVGLEGSMAGTYFRQSIVSLSKETPNATKAFAALNASFKDFSVVHSGSLLKSIEMLEQLRNRVGKVALNDALVQAFGTRGSFGLMALLDVGTAQLRTYMGQLDATGTASAAAADQLNTLSGAWKLLTNVWTNFETKLIQGTVAKNFVWLIGVLDALVGVAEQNGALAAMQNVLVSVVVTLGTLAQQVGPSVIATVRDIAAQVPAVIQSLGAGLAQVLPSVLGFLEWLPKLFAYAFANIIPMLVKFGEVIIPLFFQVAGVVLPLLVDVLTQVGGAFVQFLSDNSGNIILWFQWFAWTVESVLGLLPSLVPILNQLVGIFIQWAPALMYAAVQALPALLQAVVNIIPWLSYLAANVFPILIQGLYEFVWLIGNQGTALFQAFVQNVVGFAQWIVGNWGTIMRIVSQGMWLWVMLMGLAGQNLQLLLPKVAAFLQYLNANWGNVFKSVASAVKSALDFLADLADLLPGVAALFITLATVLGTVMDLSMTVLTVVGTVGLALLLVIGDVLVGIGAVAKSIWQLITAPMGHKWEEVGKTLSDFWSRSKTGWQTYGKDVAATWRMVGAAWKTIPIAWKVGEEMSVAGPQIANTLRGAGTAVGNASTLSIPSNMPGGPDGAPLKTENLSFSSDAMASMTAAFKPGSDAVCASFISGLQPITTNGAAQLAVQKSSDGTLTAMHQTMQGLATCAQLSDRTKEIVGAVKALLPVLKFQAATSAVQAALAQLAPWLTGGKQYSMTDVLPLIQKQWALMEMAPYSLRAYPMTSVDDRISKQPARSLIQTDVAPTNAASMIEVHIHGVKATIAPSEFHAGVTRVIKKATRPADWRGASMLSGIDLNDLAPSLASRGLMEY